MSHDFANKKKAAASKQQANKRNKAKGGRTMKSQVPGWVWLFTGIVTGMFIMFLAYLAELTPNPKSVESKPAVAASKTNKEREQDEGPRFDFYTLLPEREVIVPVEKTNPGDKPAAQEMIYILQAGSFKQAADADRLRAKLILMGLDTQVEAVSGRGNGTWHRVQVGPFTSRSKLSKARSTLINQGIETLLLKRKAET